MFKKILIANRGEIAVRVLRAAKELGLTTVAIYSEPDANSAHVQLADEAYLLEGQPAKVYLDIHQIVEIAKKAKVQCLHPGYGFLSENADFAEACKQAKIIFIGPEPEVIRQLGSKIESRTLMEAAKVQVVPGITSSVIDPSVVKDLAKKHGYPIAIKASAGGGGRGMRIVNSEAEIEQALAGAQREGASYFGNSQVYVEKYLDKPHHIEVQILADTHGNVVYLGERDCSSQRRHQKLLEETPAPNLDPKLRQKLLDAAVRGAKSLGYTSAGTFEFLVYGNEFYFLEVNTRVQVEHPITEFTTGIDIVKEQILIASGEQLSFTQKDIQPRGHAIECRINAEDASKNFLPCPGTITAYSEPSMPWVRVDSACYSGYQVLPFYDSLLAKLVVWGRDWQEAITRTKLALQNYVIEGVATTIPFHLLLLDEPAFQKGLVDTNFVEREFKAKYTKLPSPQPVSSTPSNSTSTSMQKGPVRNFEIELNQRQFKISVAELKESSNSTTSSITSRSRPTAKSGASSNNHVGEIRAAMHGVVKELLVKEGDSVSSGQKLLIFEAMKMESDIVAVKAGKITNLKIKAGDTMETSNLLMIIAD